MDGWGRAAGARWPASALIYAVVSVSPGLRLRLLAAAACVGAGVRARPGTQQRCGGRPGRLRPCCWLAALWPKGVASFYSWLAALLQLQLLSTVLYSVLYSRYSRTVHGTRTYRDLLPYVHVYAAADSRQQQRFARSRSRPFDPTGHFFCWLTATALVLVL
jgi:hypothetical protein